MILSLGPRSPTDSGYNQVQLGTWLAGVQTVLGSQPTIRSVTAAITPPPATIGVSSLIGTNFYFVVNGGTVGVTNTITLTITLSDNQVITRSVTQPCEPL